MRIELGPGLRWGDGSFVRISLGTRAMSAPESGAVNTEHPWLGLASFTEETRQYFYGREEEVAELARRVQRKLLTVLFGQSGLGKTSILRAGIVPRLRPEGHCPVYVRIDYSPESPPPTEQIKQAIFRATEASGSWTQPGTAVEGESLWEFLHHRDDILRDAAGKTVIPLLIFDQFEEIFTLAQADDGGRKRAAQFIEDLADLVENRPPKALEARLENDETIVERFDFGRADYRILIALREDYLAHLEGVKGAMPSITQNRMRLARMNGQQALAAVMKPGGKLVSQEVAESIVRFIAGGAELPNAEVEPSLLSLICRELNNARIAQGRAEISADLIAGSNDTILNEFYERALVDQPAGVRRFIEDEMLTESGFRESLAEERVLKGFAAAGAAPDTLATLVNRRLLRIEERLDARRVELTHDVLCGVVRASRERRLEREALDEAERQLAAQKAREQATRKALVRARQIAAGCAVLSVLAIVSAIFGYLNMHRARDAEAKAEQTRQMAEGARGEAEKLITYLLDDFYLELEPIGRLDIVADLSRRALDYYDALPPELRTSNTERNRALALVRYASILRFQSKLDEGEKALADALPILKGLRDGGDKSEVTAIGYALGSVAQARLLNSRFKNSEAEKPAAEAVSVLEPLAAAASPSVTLRRAYGSANNYLGYLQVRSGKQNEQGVRTTEKAREAYRGIDGLASGDMASAAAFAETTSWQIIALQNLGRSADAQRNGEEALRITAQILEKRPGHMAAQRSRALLIFSLARVAGGNLNAGKALGLLRACSREWGNFLKLDPGNMVAWGNLGNCNFYSATTLIYLGRTTEAIRQFRVNLGYEKQVGGTIVTAGMLPAAAGNAALLEAELGNFRAAQADLAEMHRVVERGPFPASSNFGVIFREIVVIVEARIRMTSGDDAAARDMLEASLKRVEELKPASDSEKLQRDGLLAGRYGSLAEMAYRRNDFIAAEAHRRKAIAFRQAPRTQLDAMHASEPQIGLALALARQGRLVDARQVIEPVIKLHRGFVAQGSDNLTQRVVFAGALFAAAVASPGDGARLLGEAAAIVDALPADMRRRKSVAELREWIAKEQGKP